MPDSGIEPRTSCSAVAFAITRPTSSAIWIKQYHHPLGVKKSIILTIILNWVMWIRLMTLKLWDISDQLVSFTHSMIMLSQHYFYFDLLIEWRSILIHLMKYLPSWMTLINGAPLPEFDRPVGLVVIETLTAKGFDSHLKQDKYLCDEHGYLFCVWM